MAQIAPPFHTFAGVDMIQKPFGLMELRKKIYQAVSKESK
jgi:hypothetical protein